MEFTNKYLDMNEDDIDILLLGVQVSDEKENSKEYNLKEKFFRKNVLEYEADVQLMSIYIEYACTISIAAATRNALSFSTLNNSELFKTKKGLNLFPDDKIE